jgi:hypothetical protein
MWNFRKLCEAIYEIYCRVQLWPYISYTLLWINMDQVLHIEFPQYLMDNLWDTRKVNLWIVIRQILLWNNMADSLNCVTTLNEDDDYHLLGDDNHHSHRRGNLKSYNFKWKPPLSKFTKICPVVYPLILSHKWTYWRTDLTFTQGILFCLARSASLGFYVIFVQTKASLPLLETNPVFLM